MSVAAALARTDLGDLLNELTGTAPMGQQRWHCIVPTHDDHDPSTTVFTDSHGTERWRCWSCGAGGTAIDALVVARSMTVAQAIATLEQRTNTVGDEAFDPSPRRPAQPTTVPLSDGARDYLHACATALWEPGAQEARNWLRSRGFEESVLRDNLVGFDPGPKLIPRDEGLPGNITTPQRRRPGLPGGTGVTFVSFDRFGEPIHVQCRLLRARNFKYANPRRAHGSIPAVSFPRSNITTGPVLVTEGIADGLIAVTAGFRSAVITSSTTLRATTASRIQHYASGERIVIALDNDDAGHKPARALRQQLGSDVAVLQLPAGQDLNDTYHRSPTWTPELNSPNTSMR